MSRDKKLALQPVVPMRDSMVAPPYTEETVFAGRYSVSNMKLDRLIADLEWAAQDVEVWRGSDDRDRKRRADRELSIARRALLLHIRGDR